MNDVKHSDNPIEWRNHSCGQFKKMRQPRIRYCMGNIGWGEATTQTRWTKEARSIPLVLLLVRTNLIVVTFYRQADDKLPKKN